jgi:poly(3-hydroxybutyrate) depolymerase
MFDSLPFGTHRITVDLPEEGSAPVTVDIPGASAEPVPLVLALHYAFAGPRPEPFTGGRMLDALRPGLAALGAIIIAPDSLGGRWNEPINEAAVVALANLAIAECRSDPRRRLIIGFSRGGEGAWHIGGRHQDLFTGAMPIAAPVPAESSLNWSIPVYAIHAEQDEVVSYRAAKEHVEKLRDNGARAFFKSVPDLTHYQTAAYAPYLKEGIDWLESEW